MSDGYCFDGAFYCENCLPVDENHPDVYLDNGDTDCPTCCSACNRPVTYTLTADGREYVLAAIKASLRDGHDKAPLPGHYTGYYEGVPLGGMVLDWAEALSYSLLGDKDQAMVDHYIASCKRNWGKWWETAEGRNNDAS